MIKEHDRIVLTEPVPAEGLEGGDVGTVVHVYPDGKAFEVEFTTLDGKTAAVATVEAAAFVPSLPTRSRIDEQRILFLRRSRHAEMVRPISAQRASRDAAAYGATD